MTICKLGMICLYYPCFKQFSNRTGYSDDAKNKYHVSTRLQFGSDLKFELNRTQQTDTTDALNQRIKLDGALNW